MIVVPAGSFTIEVYERYATGIAIRYFPAIDHAILKSDFRRRIACLSTLALLDSIIDCSNPQEPVHLYFAGDDLFEPFRRRRGLPIGKMGAALHRKVADSSHGAERDLTSQFFANVYLDGFDHFVTD